LFKTLLGLGLVFGSAQLMFPAQSQNPPAQAPDPNAQPAPQKSQTFVGKIVKAKNGQYALLTDEQTGRGLYLDDQEKAKSFEGQSVKVTGTLDMARSPVHVTDIQPA
jgi:hypothetical protein